MASTAVLFGTAEAFGVFSQRPIAFQRQRIPNSNTLFADAPGSDTGSSFYKGKAVKLEQRNIEKN